MRGAKFVSVIVLWGFSVVGCSSVDDGPFGGMGQGPDPDADAQCPSAETPDACRIIILVNDERQRQGVAPLRFDPSLSKAADGHAADMVERGYFDHDSLDGRDFSDRAIDAGYRGFPTGENIAKGQRSPEEVMEAWMNSDGHRRNILSARSNEIGAAVVDRVWVQDFGQH